ncbi:MAG TPA: alkaline phosphatase family protein [Chthoniobacterales bacterium]
MIRLLVSLVLIALAPQLHAGGKAEHVVLMVWDGLRGDFVTKENAPNLSALAASGVHFRHHHSIYPSLTSVNATALATGVYPNRSGMISNWGWRPEISGGKLTRMDFPETIRKGDELTGGHYLNAPTIAELVTARGGRTAIAGTKTAPLLHQRNPRGTAVTLFRGTTLPESALAPIVDLLGTFPAKDETPNVAADSWTTRALTESLWRDGVPEFSLLWMSEPDYSQHASGPGTKDSLGAIASDDNNLALVLRTLAAKGVADKTDVMVASDHGFSTIDRHIDVPEILIGKGFNIATDKHAKLARGQIRIAPNGGMNLYYIGEHDSATAARLVEALQQSNFASVIFTREKIDGAFPMSEVHVDLADGPDVLMTFKWNDRTNENGTPGMIDITQTGDPNRGTHGSLSPFDLHNIFIAAGPDFRRGMQDDFPTSNLDVAATIMHILGLTTPEPLDGRVVSEALSEGDAHQSNVERKPIEASRQFANGTWRETLRRSQLGTSIYIDEGDGGFTPK